MPLLKVNTAQNVQLEFQIGNIGQRILAAILDLIVVIFFFILMQYAFSTLMNVKLFEENTDIVFYLLIIVPIILYLPVSEYLWNGQTVGKRILKLKVVRTDGSSPSLGDYLLRWLLRTIDVKLGFLFIFFIPDTPTSDWEYTLIVWAMFLFVFPFPLVGIISMAVTPLGQRLGDLAANTTVIQNKRPYSLRDTILQVTEEDYQPRFLNALKLKDRDIYIIKNALEEVEKTHDYANIRLLGDKARDLLDIKDDIKPLPLLQTLVRDYTFLAKKRDLS